MVIWLSVVLIHGLIQRLLLLLPGEHAGWVGGDTRVLARPTTATPKSLWQFPALASLLNLVTYIVC